MNQEANQEAKEMVGTLTMAASFLITLFIYILQVVISTKDTAILRGLINQAVMAATILMWNINSTDLWKFTKTCFIKEG